MGLVVVPLLVTHTEVLQIERLGMTHLCAYLTPFAVDRTIGKLHKVEGILDIRIELVEGGMYAGLGGIGILELAGESA